MPSKIAEIRETIAKFKEKAGQGAEIWYRGQ
jgi:hypothetical protein